MAGARIAPLLERRRFDHAHQQRGELAAVPVEALDDPVNRLDVGRLEPAAQGVGQQLLGDATVEVEASAAP